MSGGVANQQRRQAIFSDWRTPGTLRSICVVYAAQTGMVAIRKDALFLSVNRARHSDAVPPLFVFHIVLQNKIDILV